MIAKEILRVKEVDKIPKNSNDTSIKVLNKIFSKVSRIYATSEYNKIELILDINSDLFILKEGDMVEILIEDSPFEDNKDKNPNKDIFNLDNFDELDQLKNYEYVMHGVIFHTGFEGDKSFIYASFGGLLMKYFGSSKHVCLESIKLDKRILLMIKKL